MKIKSIFLLLLLFLTGCSVGKATVQFNVNGATPIEDITVQIGNTITEPEAPSMTGYSFAGWYSDSSFNVPYDFSDEVSGDLTLHAKWILEYYSIIFEDYDGTTLYSQDYLYGEEILALDIPEPVNTPGYLFIGWGLDLPETMPDHDIVISGRFLSEIKLTSGYEDYDGFGNMVISNDTYFVVNSMYCDGKGAVFVYKFNDPGYVRKITGSGTISDDRFGSQILISGDYLFVSAPYAGTNDKGAVFIYKLSNSSYEKKFVADDLESSAHFGYSFDVYEDYLIVGTSSYFEDSIYLYHLDEDWEFDRKIDCPDYIENTQFGYKVMIEGDNIIASSRLMSGQGAVYVYKVSDSEFVRKLIDSTPSNEDFYGNRIIVSSDFLIIGAKGHNNYKGAIYIYRFSDPEYYRFLLDTDSENTIEFGDSMIVEGNYLVESTTNLPDDDTSIGAVYVFKLDDEEYYRKIENEEAHFMHDMGERLQIEDDYIIASYLGFDGNRGVIYFYKLSDEEYYRRVIGTDTQENDIFGSKIVLNGDDLYIGCGFYNEHQGSIFVYKMSDSEYEYRIHRYDTNIQDEDFGINFNIFNNTLLVRATDPDETSGIIYRYILDEITED